MRDEGDVANLYHILRTMMGTRPGETARGLQGFSLSIGGRLHSRVWKPLRCARTRLFTCRKPPRCHEAGNVFGAAATLWLVRPAVDVCGLCTWGLVREDKWLVPWPLQRRRHDACANERQSTTFPEQTPACKLDHPPRRHGNPSISFILRCLPRARSRTTTSPAQLSPSPAPALATTSPPSLRHAASGLRPVAPPSPPSPPACVDRAPTKVPAASPGLRAVPAARLWGHAVPAARRQRWQCVWRVRAVHERPHGAGGGAVWTNRFQAWSGIRRTERKSTEYSPPPMRMTLRF